MLLNCGCLPGRIAEIAHGAALTLAMVTGRHLGRVWKFCKPLRPTYIPCLYAQAEALPNPRPWVPALAVTSSPKTKSLLVDKEKNDQRPTTTTKTLTTVTVNQSVSWRVCQSTHCVEDYHYQRNEWMDGGGNN